jgi:Amt family ammonium transporter
MAMIIVTILWVVIGFGFHFGPSIGGIIGNPLQIYSFKVLVQTAWSLCSSVSIIRFISSKFAIITPALITGAFAERIRFGPYYSWFYSFYYAPMSYDLASKDYSSRWGSGFAGGTVVHECWLGGISWRNVFR